VHLILLGTVMLLAALFMRRGIAGVIDRIREGRRHRSRG